MADSGSGESAQVDDACASLSKMSLGSSLMDAFPGFVEGKRSEGRVVPVPGKHTWELVLAKTAIAEQKDLFFQQRWVNDFRNGGMTRRQLPPPETRIFSGNTLEINTETPAAECMLAWEQTIFAELKALADNLRPLVASLPPGQLIHVQFYMDDFTWNHVTGRMWTTIHMRVVFRDPTE